MTKRNIVSLHLNIYSVSGTYITHNLSHFEPRYWIQILPISILNS